MKTLTFSHLDRKSWLEARKGKITGSGLKDIVGSTISKDSLIKELESLKIEFKKSLKKEQLEALLPQESKVKLEKESPKKIRFYELIAEKLSVSEEDFDGYYPDETPMARGTRLEEVAMKRFERETGKKLDTSLVIWMRDDNENIAISPDGIVSETEVTEGKCLSSARHIEAFLTQQIPDEYFEQGLQYMIVNDKVDLVNFAFYDPRIPVKDFFILQMTREDNKEVISEYLKYEIKTLLEVDEIVNKLSF